MARFRVVGAYCGIPDVSRGRTCAQGRMCTLARGLAIAAGTGKLTRGLDSTPSLDSVGRNFVDAEFESFCGPRRQRWGIFGAGGDHHRGLGDAGVIGRTLHRAIRRRCSILWNNAPRGIQGCQNGTFADFWVAKKRRGRLRNDAQSKTDSNQITSVLRPPACASKVDRKIRLTLRRRAP